MLGQWFVDGCVCVCGFRHACMYECINIAESEVNLYAQMICHCVLKWDMCLYGQFGGLEALITGICDEWPWIKKKRELFVAVVIIYCFLGALSTTTYVSMNSMSLVTIFTMRSSDFLTIILSSMI